MTVCIIEGCEKTQKTRGLCKSCYVSAHRALARGEVPSWLFLEENGLSLPVANPAAKTTLFNQRLKQLMRDKGQQKSTEIHNGGN